MSAAEKIRILTAERCSVPEIADSLGVPRWYVRRVQRWWGYRDPTPASFPNTPGRMRHAEAMGRAAGEGA